MMADREFAEQAMARMRDALTREIPAAVLNWESAGEYVGKADLQFVNVCGLLEIGAATRPEVRRAGLELLAAWNRALEAWRRERMRAA